MVRRMGRGRGWTLGAVRQDLVPLDGRHRSGKEMGSFRKTGGARRYDDQEQDKNNERR